MPGESHGQRRLAGYSQSGHKESDTTEQLTHTHTHTHTQNRNRLTDTAKRLVVVKREERCRRGGLGF